MNPLTLAQELIKQLGPAESRTAVAALRIAILAIENQAAVQVWAGSPDSLRTVSGEPLIPELSSEEGR